MLAGQAAHVQRLLAHTSAGGQPDRNSYSGGESKAERAAERAAAKAPAKDLCVDNAATKAGAGTA